MPSGDRLNKWLRERRDELGYSRPKVATLTRNAVSGDYLGKIENEGQRPSAKVLQALAPVYQVEEVWLLRLAGYVKDDTKAQEPTPAYSERTSVTDAINHDPSLDPRTRRLMRELYNTLKNK